MSPLRDLPVIFSISVCLACPPAAESLDSATEPNTTDESAQTTEATGSTAPTTGNEATTAGPACGDGVVDPEETCDDGNGVNGDGCNIDCTPSAALVWEYRSGLLDQDEFRAVAVDGARILAGGRQEIPGNGFDRWLASFTASGEALGSTTYSGGVLFENVHAVTAAEHGIYAAGAIRAGDQYDSWLARLDSEGGIVWESMFDSGFGHDFITSASATGEGVVVAGIASLEGGLAEIWTRAYDDAGSILWTHGQAINDGAIYSAGPGLASSPDRLVVGFYTLSQQGQLEDLLMAFPSGGSAPNWTQTYPRTSSGIVGAALAPDGEIAVVTQIVPEGLGVRRLTSTGEPLWSSTECTGSSGQSVAVDSQGDVVVIGYGQGAVGENIRLCKFAADGTLRWGKDLDSGTGDDRGYAVALLPNDAIVAAGYMTSGESATDAWLAVFAP